MHRPPFTPRKSSDTQLLRDAESTPEPQYGWNYQGFTQLLKEMSTIIRKNMFLGDRLCGLVVRVLGYRSGGPGSIPGTTRKKK
jgi:hypothetical protein